MTDDTRDPIRRQAHHEAIKTYEPTRLPNYEAYAAIVDCTADSIEAALTEADA